MRATTRPAESAHGGSEAAELAHRTTRNRSSLWGPEKKEAQPPWQPWLQELWQMQQTAAWEGPKVYEGRPVGPPQQLGTNLWSVSRSAAASLFGLSCSTYSSRGLLLAPL